MQVSQIEQKAQEKTAETRYQGNGWSLRSPLAMLGIFVRGIAMGAADIVPGVSGGTMAFIFGIYEELINSIKTIGQREFIDAALHLRFREALSLINWRFLIPLGLGVVVAIFSLAGLLEYFLNHQPVYLWSFFFGLVLASVVVVSRRVGRWTPGLVAAFVAMLAQVTVPAVVRAAIDRSLVDRVDPLGPYVAALVGLAAAGFYFLNRAYLSAPASKVAPFEYTYLIWAILFGYMLWSEVPGPTTIAGRSRTWKRSETPPSATTSAMMRVSPERDERIGYPPDSSGLEANR